MATDEKSLARLNTLHPLVRESAIRAYTKACKITPVGVHPFITETSRSFERSDALYNQPWDKKDNDGDKKIDEADEKVTNAKGGDSMHNYDLALDFVNLVKGEMKWVVDANWMLVVKCFKEEGWIWGADWDNDGKTRAQGDKDEGLVDAPHFQKTLGYKLSQLKAKYKAKDFIAGTKYLNL